MCSEPVGGEMVCSAAGVVLPTVVPGQKMLVFYRPYNITVSENGGMISHGPSDPTVPLVTRVE
jgi:hypothetical protein